MANTDLVPIEDYVALAPDKGGMDILRETIQSNEVSEFDLARVKMPSGGGTNWEVPTLDGSEGRRTILGPIVLFKNSRSFWEEEYSGGNEPPDCSSPDAQHATKRDEETEIPASRDEHGQLLCDTCEYSEWGSAPGSRGQRCKMTRQLFVLTPEKLLPLVVSLPPTSLKPASQYFLSLADHMIDFRSVVTEIGLEKVSGQGVPDYSRATFRMGGRLAPEQADLVKAYADQLAPHLQRVRVETRDEVAA